MASEHPHTGSTFESWFDEQGLLEAAIKAVIATAMTEHRLSQTSMAELMQNGSAQLDRLLDSDNSGTTLENLVRAAKAGAQELRLELV